MKTFKRPWPIFGLMAFAIAVFSPHESSSMYMTNIGAMSSVTPGATTAPPELVLVTDKDESYSDIAPVSFDGRYFDQSYCPSGTDQGRLYYTDDHPWTYNMTMMKTNPVDKVTLAASPQSSYIFYLDDYIISESSVKNYGNLNFVNVSSASVTGGLFVPIVGPVDNDHQRLSSVVRNYRLSVRVVPLRTCRC